jgi:hypothetical protein
MILCLMLVGRTDGRMLIFDLLLLGSDCVLGRGGHKFNERIPERLDDLRRGDCLFGKQGVNRLIIVA